ncbi:MAG: hypothetical protein M1355_00755 [Patescibacteria group bacterium]|nr:hypothetical protein [Patescibacteria group bacterium]MCL5093656.1 hypothetical protein [Patescibacteria group bacterium]
MGNTLAASIPCSPTSLEIARVIAMPDSYLRIAGEAAAEADIGGDSPLGKIINLPTKVCIDRPEL